jgi:hypothetical protein
MRFYEFRILFRSRSSRADGSVEVLGVAAKSMSFFDVERRAALALKLKSKPANAIIAAPQIRLTLNFATTSACAPGKATPYPARSDPKSRKRTATGLRRSSVMDRYRFRIYHRGGASLG